MPIAIPASKNRLATVSGSVLVHVTEPSNISSIVVDLKPASTNINENCTVFLKAGQGWSVAPMRLFRDYSVLELDVANTKNWGKYLYFFLGEPSRWAILKNLSSLKRWEDLQSSFGVIRVSGAQLLSKSGQPVFYRPDDNAVSAGITTGPLLSRPFQRALFSRRKPVLRWYLARLDDRQLKASMLSITSCGWPPEGFGSFVKLPFSLR
jgi:hypothetical protein